MKQSNMQDRKISVNRCRVNNRQIRAMKTPGADASVTPAGTVLKKQEVGQIENGEKNSLNGIIVATVVLVVFVILLLILRRKRRS